MKSLQFLLALLLIGLLFGFSTAYAQERNYEIRLAPDVWYNDVDGIRAGIRMRGQVPGTFDDGPHRLDLGVWLGTWIPDHPVSYYVKYTNPIPSISDFNSEASISLISSIRTGFHRHGVRFDKRWQLGFNEDEFTELYAFIGAHRHYADDYLVFPILFQQDWVGFLWTGFSNQRMSIDGATTFINLNLRSGLVDGEDLFTQARAEVRHSRDLGKHLNLRTRVFGGAESSSVPVEYFTMASMASAIEWMDSGFFRAKGTIPKVWVQDGVIQVTGSGPNVRGYVKHDANLLGLGFIQNYQFYGGLNVEVDYPNPINKAFEKIPIVGDFLRLRSYTFFDMVTGEHAWGDLQTISNAGLGFALSLNIPDQLGKPRGFVFRYDVPIWLSDPFIDDNHFKYRNVFSIGAIIGF